MGRSNIYTSPVDEPTIKRLIADEAALFRARNPKSGELFRDASESGFWHGVPMQWMAEWGLPHPLYVEQARGAHLTDVDGHTYADFCLGDTGAMFGHSPGATLAAVADGLDRGFTTMLPHAEAVAVAGHLRERFRLPYWQTAMTATDANRFVIRIARALTGRPKVLVTRYCYHGSVDESMSKLVDGRPAPRAKWDVNPGVRTDQIARIVEFNDFTDIERELANEDVAVVMMEPVMTNNGMVLPADGYLEHVQALCREHGSYLLLDETHTLSTGWAGYASEHGLEPDFVVIGKAIAGGVPVAIYGFTEPISEAMNATFANKFQTSQMGLGGTLTGNAFVLRAMHATLTEVATPAAFDEMIRMSTRAADGLEAAIASAGLLWTVTRCGARAELQYLSETPRNGTESHDALDWNLIEHSHMFLLNRDVMITPFHNMILCSPETAEAGVDKLVAVFAEWMQLIAANRTERGIP